MSLFGTKLFPAQAARSARRSAEILHRPGLTSDEAGALAGHILAAPFWQRQDGATRRLFAFSFGEAWVRKERGR